MEPAQSSRAHATRTVSDIFAQLAQMQGEGSEDEDARAVIASEETDQLQQAYVRLAQARVEVERLEKAAAEQDLRERSGGNG